MVNTKGNQDIRIQIGVHVGVKVSAKLVISGNVGLDQRLPCAQIIALGLAHKGLGDSRDGGFALDGSVGVYICNFCVSKPQNIDSPVFVVDIAGNLPAHDFESVSVKAEGETAETGKVGD